MTQPSGTPTWAPKVSKSKIHRLYTSDAAGALDEDLLAEVGWALWSRCDSILTVTTAHYGRVICPTCGAAILNLPADTPGADPIPWLDENIITCAGCGWSLPWKVYHQTYRGKQLFGANAVEVFEVYHKAFPRSSGPEAKMLLIDQLIHAFHTGLTEIGRPASANLIEGSLREVILFLNDLTSSSVSSRDAWRSTIASVAWARQFLKPAEKNTEE